MRRFLLVLLATPSACQGPLDMQVDPREPKAPTRVDGALSAGTQPLRTELAMTEAGRELALLDGALAVAGPETVYRLDDTEHLQALAVGATGEAMATGPVRRLARRGNGLFVVAEGGLFHDASGRLLRSPLSQSVAAAEVTALDDLGTGEGEELWLTTSSGVERVRGGVGTQVHLSFGDVGQPSLAVGVEKDKGLLVAGSDLVSVDLAAHTATWEAKGLPQVNAVARGDDGTVYLATLKGLYARNKLGEVKLYSFTTPSEQPLAVTDVTSAFGEVLVAVDGAVAQLEASGATAFGMLVRPHARGLARDASGNTFVLDGTALVKLATGSGHTVSFATDVVPFMTAHCTSCHATGANYSPIFDLTSYPKVSDPAFSALVVKRLTADGKPPMPPSDVEVLTPTDYAVVLKWIAGGKQP